MFYNFFVFIMLLYSIQIGFILQIIYYSFKIKEFTHKSYGFAKLHRNRSSIYKKTPHKESFTTVP